MSTTSYDDESRSFELLRSHLRADLVSAYGFSNPDAGRLLNWFDPSNPEYLEHVDGWQRLLCAAVVPSDDSAGKFPLCRTNVFGHRAIDHLDPYTVGAIHQVAKVVYKWHGTPRRETNMEEVKNRLSQPLPMSLKDFELEGVRRCLAGIEPPDLNEDIGRFGPGSTFEGYRSYEKWRRQGRIPDVPANLYRASLRDPWAPSSIDFEGCTRIAEVPKSIKCNRVVSSEPAMRMFAQLAVNDRLVRAIHREFKGHVSLADQDRHNQFLYKQGACSIDLSDASDHVSCELVQAVLPQLWPVLAKVRSQYALFPDGERVNLATFAPMGCGFCFSVMTSVILGICKYAALCVHEDTGIPYSSLWFTVYGDDVIVPVAMYDVVCDLLTRAGLKVNSAKSCCTQVYRESCGRELYDGVEITPAYIRDPLTEAPASKIEQVCSALQARSFERTAGCIARAARAVSGWRYNANLQRMELCVRTVSARQRIRSLDGYAGLNRWFSVRSQQELAKGGTQPSDRQGVSQEVWTRAAWRYKAGQDYPYLWTWFASNVRCTLGWIETISTR